MSDARLEVVLEARDGRRQLCAPGLDELLARQSRQRLETLRACDMTTLPAAQLEELALVLLSFYLFLGLDYAWWWYVIFLLSFDLSMIGYTLNRRAGAHFYNAVHSFVLPVVIAAGGVLAHNDFLIGLGLIWMAHIGLDRASGYGLKEVTGFKYTHLGKIGKKR